jgi:hypothetical protein
MARWKLMTAHYLAVPGTEWEYTENSRTTGRPIRNKFQVPRFLDPRDPQDWTTTWGNRDNAEGEVIVCYAGKGQSSDIIFTGEPTPDMVPLDDEAKAISASFEDKWKWKPDSAPTDYSQSLVDRFQLEMAEVERKPAQVEGLGELVNAISAMATTNQEILKRLAEGVPQTRRPIGG